MLEKRPFAPKIITKKFLLLSSRDESLLQAAEFLDTVIMRRSEGRLEDWTPSSLQKLYAAVWDVGARFYQERDFARAAEWLIRCLALVDDANKAKCLRALSIAQYQSEKFEDSLASAREAVKLDGTSAISHLLVLRVLLKSGDARARTEFEEMLGKEDFSTEFLSIVAEESIEQGFKEITVRCLEGLLASEQCQVDKLSVLRNLVRLMSELSESVGDSDEAEKKEGNAMDTTSNGKSKNSFTEVSKKQRERKMKDLLEQAVKLLELKETLGESQTEVLWFAKKAWDLGLTKGDGELFFFAFQFFNMLEGERSRAPHADCMKLSLILSASSLLEKASVPSKESKRIAREALRQLSECRSIGIANDKTKDSVQTHTPKDEDPKKSSIKPPVEMSDDAATQEAITGSAKRKPDSQLLHPAAKKKSATNVEASPAASSVKKGEECGGAPAESLDAEGGAPPDKARPLIHILEFQARLIMEDPDLHKHVETIKDIPGMRPEHFSMIASLCMQPPFHCPDVCSLALQCELQRHVMSPRLQFPTIAALFRKLVTLASCRDESERYFEQLLQIAEKLSTSECSKYPQVEAQWMIATAWNNGTFYYRHTNKSFVAAAERWMRTALALWARLLGDQFPQKKAEMDKSYAHVLAKSKALSKPSGTRPTVKQKRA